MRVRSLKQRNPNGEFSKWWWWQERFQGRPLSGGPSPVRNVTAHLFCRLPAVAWQLPTSVLIFKPSTTTIVRTEQWRLNRWGRNQIWQWLHCTIRKVVFLVPLGLIWSRWKGSEGSLAGCIRRDGKRKQMTGFFHASFLFVIYSSRFYSVFLAYAVLSINLLGVL